MGAITWINEKAKEAGRYIGTKCLGREKTIVPPTFTGELPQNNKSGQAVDQFNSFGITFGREVFRGLIATPSDYMHVGKYGSAVTFTTKKNVLGKVKNDIANAIF